MSRPFAVFDIDGTLIRWQLYHALADALYRAGLIDTKKYEAVRAARRSWKNRAHQSSFQVYEQELVKVIDAAITSIPVTAFHQACREVVNEYKDQVYTYTRDLIQTLKRQNYLLFAISASQIEVVSLIAEHYGFDDCGGTRYLIRDNHFTGDKQVLKRDKKPELLRQLVAKHQATWEGSVGIGDSESDIPMLKTVDKPVAFNPTRLLFQQAKMANWRIVLERKSVIYELQPEHGTYTLIESND